MIIWKRKLIANFPEFQRVASCSQGHNGIFTHLINKISPCFLPVTHAFFPPSPSLKLMKSQIGSLKFTKLTILASKANAFHSRNASQFINITDHIHMQNQYPLHSLNPSSIYAKQ